MYFNIFFNVIFLKYHLFRPIIKKKMVRHFETEQKILLTNRMFSTKKWLPEKLFFERFCLTDNEWLKKKKIWMLIRCGPTLSKLIIFARQYNRMMLIILAWVS